MTYLSLFSETDRQSAIKELNCLGVCLDAAATHLMNGEFKKAAICHENIARSLHELETLKNKKQMKDKAWLLLKQIEGERQQRFLLHKMEVNIYE